ncbi:MAG: AzlD domain-containing protein [Acidobacteria bacterium]|nr:AzlD domain-containing protein [Acidobacteriota bacterium]
MSTVHVWFVIGVVGLVTFLLRFAFIGLGDRLKEPEVLRRILRLVPPTVLTALVTSSLFLQEGKVPLTLRNPEYPAALIAGLVAWRTKNLLWTILSGMIALWLFRWL